VSRERKQGKARKSAPTLGRGLQRELADAGVKARVRRTSPWGSMSEKIKSIAEPWTSQLGPDATLPQMAAVYGVCGMIWNVSRPQPSPRRAAALKEVQVCLAQVFPGLSLAQRGSLVQTICERAQTDYPDDPRFIANVDVEERGGGDFHVMVASLQV